MPAGYDFEGGPPGLPAQPEVEPGIGQRVDPNMPTTPDERLRNAFAMMMMQQPQGQAMPMQDVMAAQFQKQVPGNMDYFSVPGTGGKDVMLTPLTAETAPGIDAAMPPVTTPANPKPVQPPLTDDTVKYAFPGAEDAKLIPPGNPDYVGKPPQSAFKLPLPKRRSLAERE